MYQQSHPSANGIALGAQAERPRDCSTRSNLASFATRLESINAHLGDMIGEHWGYQDGMGVPNAATPPGQPATASRGPTHTDLLDHIESLIASIDHRVEFINARL